MIKPAEFPSIHIDHEKTTSMQNRVEDLVSKLRAKNKGSKFSKK